MDLIRCADCVNKLKHSTFPDFMNGCVAELNRGEAHRLKKEMQIRPCRDFALKAADIPTLTDSIGTIL